MFKEKYHGMNEQISPDPNLVEKMMRASKRRRKEANRGKIFFPRPVTIIAALMIVVLTATPVLAANIPGVHDLMHLISPAAAQFFMPVQKSNEDNGIRMEVVSASIHDRTVEVYITMQDLIGDRIDETTDLYDSYSIHRPFDSSAGCEFVGYDAKTKKATFLITITEWNKNKIAGDKITFSVREFISGKKKYNNIPIEVDLNKAEDKPSTRELTITGFSQYKEQRDFSEIEASHEALIPSAPMDFPIDGIDFTGIGYINGKLHIQTAVEDNLTKDNHGYFYLKDKQGRKIEYDYSVSFIEDIHGEKRIDYVEDVFDIPKSQIGEYSLYGNFVTSGQYTEGNWQVTFPIEEVRRN